MKTSHSKALEKAKGGKKLHVKDLNSEKDQARFKSTETMKRGVKHFGGKSHF